MRGRSAGAALVLAGLCWFVALGTACTSDVQRRDAHLAEAERYAAEGRGQEALIELRNALRFDPQNAEINFRLAETLKRMGGIGDALFFYRETRRLDPTRTDAAVNEADLLAVTDPEQSEELVSEVIEREPANAAAYWVRSKAATVRSELSDALAAALTAVELEPENPFYHQQVGKVHAARIRAAQVRGEQAGDEIFRAGLEAFARASAASDDRWRWQSESERAKLLSAWEGHGEEAEQAFRAALEAARIGGPAAVRAAATDVFAFARETGRADLVEVALEAQVDANPKDYASWLNLAALEKTGRGRSPEPILQRMLAANPDDDQAHLSYARILLEGGRIAEAIAHLEAYAGRSTDPPAILGALARLLFGAGKTEEARSVIERLEGAYPNHPQAILARAHWDLGDGRVEEAATALRLHAEEIGLPAAFQLLAMAEYRRGDRTAALAAVERAIELSQAGPVPVPSLRLRARLQVELGEWVGALRSLATLANSGTQLADEDRLLQARALYGVGRTAGANSILGGLLDRQKPHAGAALEFARRNAESQPERAREVLETAHAAQPRNANLLLSLAQLELGAGRAEAALARLNAALERGPASPAVVLMRARVLAAQGKVAAAQQDALRAFEARPGLPGAAALLVGLYRAGGNEEEVIRSFEEADAAGALAAPARYLLANLQLSAGNRARARELLETVIAERSDFPQAKNDLAYVLALEGSDLDRALRLAQEARQGLGDQPTVVDTLGFVYLQRGLHGPALEQFNHALELSSAKAPATSLLHYHAGLALRGLGREEEAASAFERALALDASLKEAEEALDGLRRGDATAASS